MNFAAHARQKLVDYFTEASRPRDQWLVGMEIEKMGRSAESGRPVPYDGSRASVRTVLERYAVMRGGDPVFEGDHLIGLAGPWGSLSLEPGGQVEWSSRPLPRLFDLEIALVAHLDALSAVGEELGVRWLDVAVDPVWPVTEMGWMPKARYKIMRAYLGERGRLAHRMMTQTASIQCAFDFEDAADWTAKFRAGALLGPVAAALFANSPTVDGGSSGYESFRQRIWQETDPDRCGLPAIVFDPGFGLEAWVEWILQVPAIFRRRSSGLVPCDGIPFIEVARRRGRAALGVQDWELHLSTIFTDVRSYGHLEVRTADLLRDDLVMAVPAFWTGILYQPGGPAAAADLGAAHATHVAWLEAMDDAARLGLDASAGGRPLREIAARALGLSLRGLRGEATCAAASPGAQAALLRLAAALRLEPREGPG